MRAVDGDRREDTACLQSRARRWRRGLVSTLAARRRHVDRGPFGRELLQAIEAAEIPRVGEGKVERGERAAAELGALSEPEMWGAQQRHEARTGEVRCHRFERDVERRRIRLRRERQRVERFKWHTSAAEHLAGEIEVRKRAAHDERGAM